MQAHLAAGLSAAEAARAALREDGTGGGAGPGGDGASLGGAAGDLARSLDELNEPGAQAALDRLLAAFTLETVLCEAVLPYLRDLGDRWERGEVSIAGEHFASNLLRGWLAGIARGWGFGLGPRAVLACAPGEQHELALMMFGIVLHRCGWRVEYLGASTPLAELARAVTRLRPDIAVVTASSPERFEGLTAGLAHLARQVPVALAGAGATQALAEATGASLLAGDPVAEAQRLAPRRLAGG
jgi:methanogenic corrinoid protein MtbC1